MNILITGGAGYIGSTVASALLDRGHTPIILDSLVTGCEAFTENRIFYRGDIADRPLLTRLFEEQGPIDAAIHCAALISVPESTARPYEYYRENVGKSVELFHNLNELGCRRIIFSSSASIYGAAKDFAADESTPLSPSCPYARTKYMVETVLADFCAAYDLRGLSLRYFNPIGADPEMRSGTFIRNASHIISKLVSVSRGFEDCFSLTGVDWPTRDGSGIRDYIHVYDLALAHVLAVERFDEAFARSGEADYLPINLGTGRGVTVKELVAAFEKVLGREIPKVETGPRPGDVAGAYARADRAKELLGWETTLTIEDGIRDALAWNQKFFEE